MSRRLTPPLRAEEIVEIVRKSNMNGLTADEIAEALGMDLDMPDFDDHERLTAGLLWAIVRFDLECVDGIYYAFGTCALGGLTLNQLRPIFRRELAEEPGKKRVATLRQEIEAHRNEQAQAAAVEAIGEGGGE